LNACFDSKRCGEPDPLGRGPPGYLAQRVKILPYLTAGAPWIISKLVNNQPGLICEALETSQHNGDGYVEVRMASWIEMGLNYDAHQDSFVNAS
jgi:hypothetical protein|tara:strand:- start:11 stop:292 length:282 start_codon:yes stop_codon:yes gene_type:complete